MVTASQDNVLCIASKVAAAGKTHVITKILISYKTALTAAGLVQIKDGTSIIGEYQLFNNDKIDLTNGIPDISGMPGTTGNTISVELAASGTAGNLGKITLIGYTIG